MGNGSGLKPGTYVSIDIETSPLTLDDLEKAAQQAVANFGKQHQVFMPFFMGSPFTVEANPEYRGTPWANMNRLTKREHAIAKIHTFLKKVGALNKFSEEDFIEVKNKSVKRLKRARWAQYNRRSK